NIVPGIGFSPDKMLQGRLFAYADAQRYRLGVNHHQIPVNAPKCPYHSFHRDGAMRTDGNLGSTLHYEPNSHGEWEHQRDTMEPALEIEGDATHRDFGQDDANYYEQPGNLFRLMTDKEKEALFNHTANDFSGAEEHIKLRYIIHCYKADPAYGERVAKAAGINWDKVEAAMTEE